MRAGLLPLLLGSTALIAVSSAQAQDATWLASPGSNDFSDGANWSTGSTPGTGTAFLGASSITALELPSASIVPSLGGITLNADAGPYTLHTSLGSQLNLTGAGIVVNGGSLALQVNGKLYIRNNATTGSAVITLTDPNNTNSNGWGYFYNNSSAGTATINVTSGTLRFYDASTAGSAAITNNNNMQFHNASTAGSATITNNTGLLFHNTSTADRATITNNNSLTFRDTSTAGSAAITNKQTMVFSSNSTAGNATITNSGNLSFRVSSTAGNATITNSGNLYFQNSSTAGSATITTGNNLEFSDTSTAGDATITNTGNLIFRFSSTAGNATIQTQAGNVSTYYDSSTGGTSRQIVGGMVDLRTRTSPAISFGSIEGAGWIRAASTNVALTVGLNNLSTTFSGRISGDNISLTKVGTGTLTLTGASPSFFGQTFVDSGTLTVNGTLGGSLTLLPNGRLQGAGTIGNTTVLGTVAPGNSIGTINVGNITFNAGSIYEVEVDAAGQSDRVAASGTATINGGSVRILAGAGNYAPATTYTILTANGGRTGTFTGGVTSNLAFLDPSLSYDANNVYLTITRNSLAFQNVGITPNQVATGGGVESFGSGNAVYDAVLNLSAPQAQDAFDQFSGDIHASATAALIEDSRFVRNAVNDRIRAAFDGVGANGGTVMTYGDDGPQASAATTDRFAVWGQAFGSWGHTESDGNAARLNRKTGGLFFGADAPVFDSWRFGAVAGYSNTAFDVKDRLSSGSSDNYHVGLYGGTSWGDLAFRTGAAYAWHDISTNRTVDIPGISDSLKGDYNAATTQVFGELGYRMQAGNVALEPFGSLAYVNVHTDGFAERGGVAALSGASGSTDTAYTTLGIRAATTFDLGGASLTAKGMVGWRHAFGDVTPESAMRFASGGNAFSIAGAPIAENAAVIEAGLDYTITPNATLGISYNGQFGSGLSDQSVRASFNVKF